MAIGQRGSKAPGFAALLALRLTWGLDKPSVQISRIRLSSPVHIAGTGRQGPATFVQRCYLCATHLSVDRTTCSVSGNPKAQAMARPTRKIVAIIALILQHDRIQSFFRTPSQDVRRTAR